VTDSSGVFLIHCAGVYQWGAKRHESGDGDRARKQAAYIKTKETEIANKGKPKQEKDDSPYFYDRDKKCVTIRRDG
jgi:hypothetical protein